MDEEVETLRGTVALLHNKKGVRAFKVICDLGAFIVIDYECDPLDREVYWERNTVQIRPGREEYDIAGALVRGYVNTLHTKMKLSEKNKWPKLK